MTVPDSCMWEHRVNFSESLNLNLSVNHHLIVVEALEFPSDPCCLGQFEIAGSRWRVRQSAVWSLLVRTTHMDKNTWSGGIPGPSHGARPRERLCLQAPCSWAFTYGAWSGSVPNKDMGTSSWGAEPSVLLIGQQQKAATLGVQALLDANISYSFC